MTIISRKGDQGKSYWLDKAVDKDDLLLDVIGAIDEVQCSLGIAKAEVGFGTVKNQIEEIQKDLWSVAGQLAGYNKSKGGDKLPDLENRIKDMEVEIEEWERGLPTIRDFALPGANKKEALIQLCRSMVRRV